MWRPSSAVLCIGGLLVAAGCSKQNQDGLPPATEWQAQPTGASSAEALPVPPPEMTSAMARANPHGAFHSSDPTDPHAGLDMDDGDDDPPSNPHAGLDMSGADPSNPHAGLDMSKNPHGAGGTDVTKMGLAAPDPDRAIDPNHHVTGLINLDPKAKAKVKAGTSVFLIVKRAGADGAPSGPPLAVDKLTWRDDGVPFELTEAQAMVAGTQLTGDVVVMARYDQDSDALTKEPGDVTGQISVKIPADHVVLSLDTVLP
jgi:hypothetical protein